jgi:hypothetical protein
MTASTLCGAVGKVDGSSLSILQAFRRIRPAPAMQEDADRI